MLKLGKELHHAYLIEGERETVLPQLRDTFDSELKIERHGNADYSEELFDTLTIEDARSISERQMRMSSERSALKLFVIAFNFITREAQNALLKVFEEPTEGTHFFLITRSSADLLPTLRSRLLIVKKDGEEKGEEQKKFISLAADFVEATKPERLKIIKTFLEEISDEERSKADALRFLDELERKVHKKKFKVEELETILKAKDYTRDRSSSLKLILENVALSLE